MTVDQGAGADVKIRVPRIAWMQPLVLGGVFLLAAVLFLGTNGPGFALFWLVMTCVVIAEAFWLRTCGVDLTPESANLRGIRRRSVPWPEVQAVVRHQMLGSWVVRLILESGQPVMLRAPTSFWGFGSAEYEQDFNRIGQWWLAHRGPSWRPLLPEAPQRPVQG